MIQMHELLFLQDLAIIMVVAGLVTVLCHRFKQPVVLGYILAGFIVGPHTPPFPLVHDEQTIKTLAELGVILLMFSLGQHFSLRKLASVGATAAVASLLEIALMAWIGYVIGRWFGWSAMDSLFLGAILSISSTTIIVKALNELGKTKEHFAHLIFGILIVEDLLGIAMIALLSTVATTGSLQAGEILGTLGRLGVFLAMVLVIGLLTVPWLLRYVARYRSNEMLLVAVLGICFGTALLAANFGYSVALGAFLAGTIVAEARESHRVEDLIEPVRDMFSAVFFVAIGMLLDPHLLAQYWLPIAVITAAVVIGKVAACSLGPFLTGNDARTSFRVGMGMAQIGEFSFIIAQLGLTLKVTSDFLYPIAVAVSVITTLLTPYLIKSSDAAVSRLEQALPKSLSSFLGLYQQWVAQIADSKKDEGTRAARRIVMGLVFQVALDLVLITGLFIAANALAGTTPKWLQFLPPWTGGHGSVLWTLAVIIALPIFVHAFLKMRALATVLAELGVVNVVSREHMPRIRAMAAAMILVAVSAAVVVWFLVIGTAILPPWPVLTVLLVLVGLTVAVLWRRFSQLYAKAQLSLRETLNQPPETRQHERPLSTLLQDARLESVEIDEKSPAAGRLIRELELRSRTGASVVGIDRRGVSIINPGPDEELLVGDKVLLIGTKAHLDQGKRALAKE